MIRVCVNVCVFVCIFKVRSWCIRPLIRGQVDPSALSLARESKGYVVCVYIYIFVFWCIGSFAKFENVSLIYSYMLCQFVIVILPFVNL